MDVCLSPNGYNVYAGKESVTRLLVGTVDGVVTLQRSGRNWSRSGHSLSGQHISSLLFEPARGGLFAGVHGGGLFASTDGGENWESRMHGLSIPHVFSLGCAVRDGQIVLYAGTEPAHLFESLDYGETWSELPAVHQVPGTEKWVFPAPPHTAHVKTVTFDPRDTRTMYVGVEQGALLRSRDAGQTFEELDEYSRPDDRAYRDVHRILLRPSNPKEMFITTGMGLYGSTDGGGTWEHLTKPGSRVGYPDWLLFSPLNDGVMFMSGAEQNPGMWRQSHSARSTVMRSLDGGRTWQQASKGLPDDMRANIEAMALGSFPDGFSIFAGNTDGEVYASEDGAESWTLIASGLAPVSKGGHYMPLRAA